MMKKNLNNIEDKIMRLKFIKQIILLLALSGHSTVAVASNFKLNSEARIKTQISKSYQFHNLNQANGSDRVLST